ARRVAATAPARHERGVRHGVAVLRRQPVTRTAILVGATTIAVSGFTTAALYSVVTTDLRLPSTFLGILASAQGAGSIVGGLVVGRLLARYGEITVGAVGALLVAAVSVGRCLPWWPLTIVCGVVA